MHAFVARPVPLLERRAAARALCEAGVRVLDWDEMDDAARELMPSTTTSAKSIRCLTPITIDPAHPFPRVLNKALCLALLLRRKRKGATGPVAGRAHRAPRALPRFVPLPSSSGTHDFIFLARPDRAQRRRHVSRLRNPLHAAFRVTRNSNLYFQEEESRTLLETVRSELHNRRKGDAVRLEIEDRRRPRNRRPPAHELRARRLAGLPHRRARSTSRA